MKVQKFHCPGGAHRFLQRVQDVGHGIYPYLIAEVVYAHDLLSHGLLVGITWIFIVIREGVDGGADAQNHGRMDLSVHVHRGVDMTPVASFLQYILGTHSNHGSILLISVNVLHYPLHNKVAPYQNLADTYVRITLL